MIIYKITNVVNGMMYIGQTSQPIMQRWYSHISRTKNGSKTYLHNAIRMYGADSFMVEKISEHYIKDDLNIAEINFIKEFNCKYPNGYNLNDGGYGGALGRTETIETRNKKRLSQLGNKNSLGHKHTDDAKAKMRLNSARNKPWLGKTHTDEYKIKMSESCKKSMTTELRKRISESVKRTRANKRWSTKKVIA